MTSCSLEYDVGYFRRIDLGPLRSEVNHTRGGHYPLRTYSRTARFVGAGGQEMFACKHRFVMNISRVPPLAVAADENRRHCTALHSIRAVRAERGGGGGSGFALTKSIRTLRLTSANFISNDAEEPSPEERPYDRGRL